MITISFDNHYLGLGDEFFVRTKPTQVTSPTLIKFNDSLSESLGFSRDALSDSEIAATFSGNVVPVGADSVAMVYSGHQFGHFNPVLGDGRAILLGEVIGMDQVRYGIQLKGAGRTAFSRSGDGRAALGPVLREYLLSEAMHKLGVPTTRALAAVTTGESVYRDTSLPGAVITRVARSFIRVGTFEYFASQENLPALRELADYVIARHFPSATHESNPYIALLQCVVEKQASLIAQWMQLGFIHGVMNTDNMSVIGDTIDYGPCAFMDYYNPQQVYSYIDRRGRYAFHNQPSIGLWNLSRFAEALLPLISSDKDESITLATDVLKRYQAEYENTWQTGMLAKCGLHSRKETVEFDRELIQTLLQIMSENNADYTLTFRYLSQLSAQSNEQDTTYLELFTNSQQFDTWLTRWRQRLQQENLSDTQRQEQMNLVNPLYIPRNHLIETAIRAAEDDGNFSPFHTLYEVLQNPYADQKGCENYRKPPQSHEIVKNTFCGT